VQISFLALACWRRQFMHCNTSTVHMMQLFFCVPKMAAVVGDNLSCYSATLGRGKLWLPIRHPPKLEMGI
jgi:hypothetical protein